MYTLSSLPLLLCSSFLYIEYLIQFHLPYPQDCRNCDTHVMSVRQYLSQLKVVSYFKIMNTMENDLTPLKVKFF